MSQSLAQLLVDERRVSAAEVDEALKRQVVHGGGLDTNLLEAGAVTEHDLLAAMGRAYGLPVVGRDEIDAIGDHIPRLFPLLFAETYHLVPYRLEGQELGVLVSDAGDEQLFARIHERLRLFVRPAVTTEVRLHYAMQRLYQTALLPRYRALLERLDGEGSPPRPQTGPEPPRVLSWGVSSAHIPAPAAGQKRPEIKVGGLLGRLAAATDRDTIVDILLEAVLSTFEFAGVFLVQAERVNGWRGVSPEATRRIARLSMPVELPSVFQTIYATNGHYLGPLPGNSINTRLMEELGRQPPRAAFLAPVLVGGKLAAILYADNGPRGVSSKRVASILLLTHRAGMCLEGLIRARKSRAGAAEPPPSEEAGVIVATEGDVREVAEFEPVVRPPPLPAETRRVLPGPPPPAPPGFDAGEPAEPEQPRGAVWRAVSLESLDTEGVTDELAVNAAPEAAEADFREGLAPHAGGAEIEDAEAEPPEEESKEDYVAFGDIDERPEESVEEWEDVFVEAMAAQRGEPLHEPPRRDSEAAPSVSWEDVVAEARAAPELTAARPAASIEVAGTVVDEREILVDSLDAADPAVWKGAVEQLLALGTGIDEILRERFPGHVRIDPFAAELRLPPFAECSGLLALLTARGASAAPVVLPHLESNDPAQRFFAIYFFYAVHYASALDLLARRLYDAESRNRYLAADALRCYQGEPGYRRILQSLRDHLKVPVLEAQVATVQVLGQLRDPSAVPSLIPLVVSPGEVLSRAAASALTVVTGCSFGADVAEWAEWWRTHYNKPREVWLLEGTRSSDPGLRQLAAREFELLTGEAPSEQQVSPEPPPAVRRD